MPWVLGEIDVNAIDSVVAEGRGLVVTVLLVGALLLGLATWALGRKLARPACAVSGVVLGAMGGLLLAELLRGQGAFAIPLVIGAGIAGGLVAVLLFRVWMGISAAALLALAVPAAMVVWQDTPAPADAPAPDPEPSVEPAEPPAGSPGSGSDDGGTVLIEGEELPPELAWFERFAALVLDAMGEANDEAAEGTDPDAADEQRDLVRELTGERIGGAFDEGKAVASEWYAHNRERVIAWWGELSSAARRGLYIGAALGAALGLGLGLAVPYTAAAVQSALVGAMVMLLAGRELVARHAPEWSGWVPQTPRGMLIWVGLITVLGVVLQWTLFHKRADK